MEVDFCQDWKEKIDYKNCIIRRIEQERANAPSCLIEKHIILTTAGYRLHSRICRTSSAETPHFPAMDSMGSPAAESLKICFVRRMPSASPLDSPWESASCSSSDKSSLNASHMLCSTSISSQFARVMRSITAA